MIKIYSRVIAAATFCLILAGCDSINDAINDALPEISIGDGVLGLGGSAGTELSGSFAAGKISATASFSHSESFDDLETGDINSVEKLKTKLAMQVQGASVILTKNNAAELPDQFSVTGSNVSWTVADGTNPSVSQSNTQSFSAVLTRSATCSASAASCTYSAPSGTAALILASYDLSESVATSVIAVVGKATGAASTENTATLSISLTVDPGAGDYSGVTASIRVNEVDTVVQANLF